MLQALANSAAFWVLAILLLGGLYLLPTLIAATRRLDHLGVVFVVNLVGGTTGVGWLAAMILACWPRPPAPVPVVPWPPPGGAPGSWPLPDRPAQTDGTRSVVVLQADTADSDRFGSEPPGRRRASRRGAGAR